MIKKFMVLILSVIMGVFPAVMITGCGASDTAANSVTDIELMYWKTGMGEKWFNALIEGFEKKYPEYKVYPTASSALNEINSGLQLRENNTVDLYFSYFETMDYYDDFMDMKEILDYTNEGENKTIREKFDADILDMYTDGNGNVKYLNYGGAISGFCYHKSVIDGVKYQLPRTTDELEMLVIDLSADGVMPFIHFSGGGYWQYMAKVWQAQYDGLDYFNNCFLKLNTSGDRNTPQQSVLNKKDGRYEALKVFEKIITPEFVYTNSNSMAFTKAQTLFLEKKAALMIDGGWLMLEMSESASENAKDVSMMKTPVISSIIDKCETIKNDDELCAVIDKVDAVSEGQETISLTGNDDALVVINPALSVSEKDWNKIYEARNMMYSNQNEHYIAIPKYSNAKEGAIKFVEYFYSDEGINKFVEATHVPFAVKASNVSTDKTKWADFEKQLDKLSNETIIINSRTMSSSDMFLIGGVQPFAGKDITPLCAKGAAHSNADAIWDSIVSTIDRNWGNWLTDSGFLNEGYNK